MFCEDTNHGKNACFEDNSSIEKNNSHGIPLFVKAPMWNLVLCSIKRFAILSVVPT